MKVTKGANFINFEFTDEEIFALENDLLVPMTHFEQVASEKIANCKRRLLQEWLEKIQQERRVAAIPTGESELLALIISQPDYKNRMTREEESNLILKGGDLNEPKIGPKNFVEGSPVTFRSA